MSIQPAPIRQEIQVRFPDGQAFNAPRGTTVLQFMEKAKPQANGHIVAALVNKKLRELGVPLKKDSKIAPVTIASSDGMRIYRRSLSFLMIVAARHCFPEQTIEVKHSMPFGGYYCERSDRAPFSSKALQMLKDEMSRIVAGALPIRKVEVPLDDALALFRGSGDIEKAALFTRRRKDYLTLYELDGILDYFHGFMVPNSSYLAYFDLHLYGNGFILHFPRKQNPDGKLLPFEDETRLARVFQEYGQWLKIMGVSGVAALNDAIRNGRLREIILVAEAFHQQQLSKIANEITQQRPGVILISGPTSAGKTTFSKRLAIQLLAKGIFPITMGMDNYFVNRDQTPRDEKGEYNFEALEAVDVPLFRNHLKALLNGETITQPRYNFHTGLREEGDPLYISNEHVIIIEGIHGLNPKVVEGVPPEAVYRIFISAFTQLNLDKHNRVPTTDTRLLRRIVRDAEYRGYTAADTIKRWLSVRRGEKRYIFPNQQYANVFFNSALVYELSVLKRLAFPLLLQVEPGTPERVEANRLIAFLQWFDPIPKDSLGCIPNDSILREFVGDSVLETYEPMGQIPDYVG
ncbi:MAG: nucleoside kinase [Chloroflexota bacterium]